MNSDIQSVLNGLPSKWQTHITTILVASMILGRVLHAVQNGGGLKTILASIWLGKTTQPSGQNEAQNH